MIKSFKKKKIATKKQKFLLIRLMNLIKSIKRNLKKKEKAQERDRTYWLQTDTILIVKNAIQKIKKVKAAH